MLPATPLHAICDADTCERAGWTVVDLAAACLDGGAEVLQVRAKHASSRSLFDLVCAVVARAGAAGALVIVNDRADIARLAAAGGVHLGQDDLPHRLARGVAGPTAVVGVSTHTIDQIDAIGRDDVDYVAIGPVFPTSTKDTGYDAIGLERVAAAAERARARAIPLVAIGGITLDRAAAVIAAGAQAVAVISDLLVGNDPAARVRTYLSRLQPSRGHSPR